MRRPVLTAFAVLLAALLGGLLWLGASNSGLQATLQLASVASGGRLTVGAASGRLLGPLHLDRLRWHSAELQVDAADLELDWSPAELLHGRLQIAALTAERLQIVSTPAGPAPPPDELLLPLSVAVERLAIATLAYGNLLTVHQLSARFASDGRQHRLHELHAETGGSALRGEATLDGRAPLPLDASAEITSRLAEQPLAVSLQASGPLARLALQVDGRQGLAGSAEAVLTPFAAAAFASARLTVSDLDPAVWLAGAPAARLNLDAELRPQGDGVAGRFTLNNALPGPLDRQRLPLLALGGELDWQAGRAALSGLNARLPGGGELAGRGEWRDGSLELTLAARALDAARLVSTLHATRLAGSVSASLAANQQRLGLDLQDRRFALRATASHAGTQLEVAQFELSAGDARLALSGDMDLAGERTFAASGRFSRFDPSRFARLPAADINGQFTAAGRLTPQPQVSGRFQLSDSRLAGQPLHGQGQVNIDWPRIPQLDLQLSAGANRLHARGAFGRPGDTLTLAIAAPALGPYGVDGSLDGQLELGGSLQQPRLQARLQAPLLGLPGVARLQQLSLEAEAGRQPNAPLQVRLAIGQLATPAQPELAKNLRLQADGSLQAHRLQAAVEVPAGGRLELAAAGGLDSDGDGPRWHGRLLALALDGAGAARSFRLTAPAELRLACATWSFGPAQLAGTDLDWRASVHARAEQQRLQAGLSARGTRLGRIDGELAAGLRGAWALDRTAAWRGSLRTEIADLGWLAELIGEEWRSAGQLVGDLQLAGTPAQPSARGQFRGERLALRQPGLGLNLVDGELAVELADRRLLIGKLAFASQLQAVPRPLRVGGRDDVAALTARPGRLEISGQLALDQLAGGDSAVLDFRLDRLGAMQLPEQWLLLSGSGRLRWNGETLGASGRLAVDAGYWQLAPGGMPRLSDDVVLRRSDAVAAPGLRPKVDLDISTELGRNFLFAGAGLSSRLAGELRLRASGRDLPRASGSIRLRDGRFDAYGQQLVIERGILNFQGLLDNPALDVRAVRPGLPVSAGVQISGSAQRPVIRLVSDPELPDAEKLAWLVLGHGPEAMGAGDATILLSAAGGLLGNDSGNVVQQLKRTFGIDEFAVRQGEIGATGGRQASSRIAAGSVDTTATTGSQILSIGKRLSSNALLSYEQALGRAEGIVKLTVNLNRQVSVIGRAGSDNALDIFYTLSFGRPARRPEPPPRAGSE